VPPQSIVLVGVYLVTSFISVVTGGTSLITVPVMIQVRIEPHVAVATNMLTLAFLRLGGTVPFLKGGEISGKRLAGLVGPTLIGSVLGAVLLVLVPVRAIPLVVALAMLMVVAFSMMAGTAGIASSRNEPARHRAILGYILTFVLGVYGGFFSGGYVALLTAVLVHCFAMTFLDAVALTKALNLVSSLVATAAFAMQGLIDWKLGIVLGAVSFGAAAGGASVARNLSNRLLRQVFLAAVVALAAKTLVYGLRS
jgi:uncharacterized protein